MSEFLKPLNVDLGRLSSLTPTRVEDIKVNLEVKITAGALSPGFSKPNKFQEIENNFKASNATMMAEAKLIQSRLDGEMALAKQTAGASPELVKVADLTGQGGPAEKNSAPSNEQADRANEKRLTEAKQDAKRDERLAAKGVAEKVAIKNHGLAKHAQEVAEKKQEKTAESRGIAV